jgi:hypothetical protein
MAFFGSSKGTKTWNTTNIIHNSSFINSRFPFNPSTLLPALKEEMAALKPIASAIRKYVTSRPFWVPSEQTVLPALKEEAPAGKQAAHADQKKMAASNCSVPSE